MLEVVNIAAGCKLVEEPRHHCRRMLWIQVFTSLFPSFAIHIL